MDPLSLAVYRRLRGDDVLDGLLARSVIEAQEAAVYTTDIVPPSAKMPYVHAPGESVTDVPDDRSSTARFRDIARDIGIFDERPEHGGGSVAAVNAIADRVRALFHRQPLWIEPGEPGYGRVLDVWCWGPIGNNGPRAFGRVVTLRVRVQSSVEAGA